MTPCTGRIASVGVRSADDRAVGVRGGIWKEHPGGGPGQTLLLAHAAAVRRQRDFP